MGQFGSRVLVPEHLRPAAVARVVCGGWPWVAGGGEVAGRWASQPRWAKCVVVAYMLGFGDGTGAHIRDLVGGGLHAYSHAPVAVQVFFVALVVLDPLVVVLLLRMRPLGAGLAGGVIVVDIAANWFVHRHEPSL